MNQPWTMLKNIISKNGYRKGMFLLLIDSEGTILSANAAMLKTLHLGHPKKVKSNILQLLHPGHTDLFRDALYDSEKSGSQSTTELYLKNGYYHPVKWQINCLGISPEDSRVHFLCTGYKLADEERLKRFNQIGEANYQLIVESLNAGILVQDHQGELIAANRKAAEIFDTTLERLYQLADIKNLWNTHWRIVTENGEPVPFEHTPFMTALRTGKMQSEVLKIRLRSGEDHCILFNCQPLADAGFPVPYSVVSNIVDVTREKDLSNEVKDRDRLFQSFMNRTPNLAWVLDEEGTLLFASRSFYKYFGLTKQDAVGKNIVDLIPAGVAEALNAMHRKVLETGQSVETNEKVKWTDGSSFLFHINIFPVEGSNGKRMVGGHAVNLADRDSIQKQLREANDRLLLLSRTTSDAIWEWDMQTGKIFRNDALMDMIGYHLDDPKGLSWWLRRIHPEDRDRVSDKVKESTEKNMQSWEDEYRFKCADGAYKHMRDKGFIVYENGLPVKMIGSLQDVTDLKNLEGELLEEKLRTQKEISETAIRVQEKERTRIGYELHDNVNQLLSTVKLFVDMLTPASQEEGRIKKKSVEYLINAIDEIRKLSKELSVPQLRAQSLVESIRTIIDDICISGVVRIKFTYDSENDLLSYGKKVTVFRIVQEQVKNILKYSKARNEEIFLQSKADELQLVIKDDGVGFDTRQSSKGIGFSNIHDRVKFYNGKVELESAPGKGCMLSVWIPLND